MTRVPGSYVTETQWMDAGIEACRELRVSVPVYATVAIADTALRQQVPAAQLAAERDAN